MSTPAPPDTPLSSSVSLTGAGEGSVTGDAAAEAAGIPSGGELVAPPTSLPRPADASGEANAADGVAGAATGAAAVGASAATTSATTTTAVVAASADADDADDAAGDAAPLTGIYATWYPPVERTLRLLSMVYRVVDAPVFSGLAHEAVRACVAAVSAAAARIAAAAPRGDEDGAREHARLFLLWQLLCVREQMAPFDVDFGYTERRLDFVRLRELVASVARGEAPVRALARLPGPGLTATTGDSRGDLEAAVRGAAEEWILDTCRLVLRPLLSFLASVATAGGADAASTTAVVGDSDNDGDSAALESAPLAPDATASSPAGYAALKASPDSFAHPAAVAATWAAVVNAIDTDLPPIVERLRVYLSSSAAAALLLRPVRRGVADAAAELLAALPRRYSLEEREAIGVDGAAVEDLLGRLDGVLRLPPVGGGVGRRDRD